MLKQLKALIRGRTYEATEKVVDHNALTILRQQIRDCAEAIAAARRAVAVAIAQNEQEVQQHKLLLDRIEDLEGRTTIAIEKGQANLVREAAEMIALLEAERNTSEEAQRNFTTEIDRLKSIIRSSEARLRDLQRGQRIVAAAEETQRLRNSETSLSSLKDAEETLARLRTRQKQIDATATAMAEIERSGDPSVITEKLAVAGCGASLTTSADAVIERLTKRLAAATPVEA